MRKYWNIRNQGKGRAEILIYEQIGEGLFSEGLGAKQFAKDLKALGDIDQLDVRINSEGGSVFEGQAIYTQLKNHKATKTVYIDGLAASIASVIAMAGDTIIMPENATMMIHDPWAISMGRAEDMRKSAEALDTIKLGIIAAYRDKSGLPDDEISTLMAEETWMTAEDALERGFVDEIAEPVKAAASINKIQIKNRLAAMAAGRGKTMDIEMVKNLKAMAREFKAPDAWVIEAMENGTGEEGLRQRILAEIKKSGTKEPLNISVTPAHEGKPFNSLGEQLMAVITSTRTGKIDNRLMEVRNAPLGGSEAVPSDGGFLVQSDFTTQLMDEAIQTSVLAPRCRTLPIGANSNSMSAPVKDETSRATGSRWGGVQVYRTNEAGTVTAKKPKFALLSMKLEKLMGLCYLTDELLQDATLMEAFVRQAYAEEMGFVLDDEIIRGTGAGQCLGILNSDALVTVSKETGQLAKTIEAQNLYNMFARIPARLIAGAEWYINQEIWPQIFALNQVMGTGGAPLFYNPGGISAAPNGYLMGRPIVPIEQASALGTAGDIILANMKEYVLIEKGGLKFDQSIHVQFLTDEVAFRFIVRNNGQPRWKSSVTPYKADTSFKVSPFITLETRS